MIDPAFWQGRRVLLTGHTGFKGAWMILLLRSLGAEVAGFALPPDSDKGLFEVAQLAADVDHRIGDIRGLSELEEAVAQTGPSIVIHMAAQSLVKASYDEPVGTYATNVMGTGYLTLAQQLASRSGVFAEGWNFGPGADSEVPVSALVARLAKHWGARARWTIDEGEHAHEASLLNSTAAKRSRGLAGDRWSD